MDDDRFPPNGVTKNGREIVIVDDLTPHLTASKSSCNGHAANGFHSASPSLEDEDGEDDGQEDGAIPSNGGEFLTESSVDEECADDVSEEHDDCAIVEEVSTPRNGAGRVAPSACAGPAARPSAAETRQEPLQPSPFSSPHAELSAPPHARPASPPPSQTGSNQKVLLAAKESVPNGQPNRRKHQRPNSSSLSNDCAAGGGKGSAAAVANPSRGQRVVKAPDYAAAAGGGGVCRSRSEERLQRGAPPPPPPSARLTRRANSGCNGLQSNGSDVCAGGVVGAKSRSQSVDHERVRVERIPGERRHVVGCILVL